MSRKSGFVLTVKMYLRIRGLRRGQADSNWTNVTILFNTQ